MFWSLLFPLSFALGTPLLPVLCLRLLFASICSNLCISNRVPFATAKGVQIDCKALWLTNNIRRREHQQPQFSSWFSLSQWNSTFPHSKCFFLQKWKSKLCLGAKRIALDLALQKYERSFVIQILLCILLRKVSCGFLVALTYLRSSWVYESTQCDQAFKSVREAVCWCFVR